MSDGFGPRAFVGGHLVLDFVNTVAGRPHAPRERLVDVGALLDWAARSGAFAASDLAVLRASAARHPRRAATALASLRALRETLFEVLLAAAQRRPAPARALASLDAARRAAGAAAALAPAADGAARGGPALRLGWPVERTGLSLVAHVVVDRAVALLTAGPIERLCVCAGDDCSWLFLDRSKGGRRRWCDMTTCGNVAKARRHLARRKAAAGTAGARQRASR